MASYIGFLHLFPLAGFKPLFRCYFFVWVLRGFMSEPAILIGKILLGFFPLFHLALWFWGLLQYTCFVDTAEMAEISGRIREF